jgi:maltose phosphorylase
VEEGLHITSMAGTWMSIVEGFGGMRVLDDKLSFTPQIPSQWKTYSFKVNFRNRIIKVVVTPNNTSFELSGTNEMSIRVNGKRITLLPGKVITV